MCICKIQVKPNRLVLAALLMTVPSVVADDSIVADLNKAKAAHAKEIVRLQANLLAAIDTVIKQENDRGAGIDYLLKERKGFADNGVTPILPKLLPLSRTYLAEKKTADAELEKAYNSAVSAALRNSDLVMVTKLRAELKALRAGAQPGPIASNDPVGTSVSQELRWDFATKAALDAKKRFDQAMSDHKDAYDKGASTAKKELLRDLNAALQEATKAGYLDDALKIRTAIRHLENNPSTPDQVELPLGKWQLLRPEGVIGIYEFRADRTVRWTEKARQAIGRMTIKGGTIIVVYDDDRTERMTPSDQRLIIEHWVPSSKYPSAYPGFFYAEKVK